MEDIIDLAYEGESQCNCISKKLLSDYTNYKKYCDYCRDCDFTKTVHIFAFFRLGLYKTDEESVEQVRRMSVYKSFSGGLIARNNSAFFLIGCQNDRFIYLDPHFI